MTIWVSPIGPVEVSAFWNGEGDRSFVPRRRKITSLSSLPSLSLLPFLPHFHTLPDPLPLHTPHFTQSCLIPLLPFHFPSHLTLPLPNFSLNFKHFDDRLSIPTSTTHPPSTHPASTTHPPRTTHAHANTWSDPTQLTHVTGGDMTVPTCLNNTSPYSLPPCFVRTRAYFPTPTLSLHQATESITGVQGIMCR
jgi:hypothetical protein